MAIGQPETAQGGLAIGQLVRYKGMVKKDLDISKGYNNSSSL